MINYGKLVNFIVTISNLWGLYPLFKSLSQSHYCESLLIFLTVLASFLMHISETKHQLPGLYFINYSYPLLWFDRIMAVTSSIYVFTKIWTNWFILFQNYLLFKIILGLSLNYVSERKSILYWDFMFSHVIWHLIAYQILYDII